MSRGDWDLLGRWYRASARDLPWRRRSSDPWAVLVSEIMLQQTRVETVLRYYDPFLERFPSATAMARSPLADVLAAWSGLGYYRRARHLHAAAVRIDERHGGRVPGDPVLLRELPGIGPYTAGAVLSIAFGLPEPVLDGNVARVLSRYRAVEGDPRRATTRRVLWRVAGEAIAGREPGELNQALMELGARVCVPEGPDCGRCPIARGCLARRTGMTDRFPEAGPRPAVVLVDRAVAVLRRRGRWLLARRRAERRLEDFLEFPGLDVGPGEPWSGRLAEHVRERHGLAISVGERLGSVRHQITHHRITCHVFAATPAGRIRTASTDLVWIAREDLPAHPIPSQTRKVLALAESIRKSG